MIPVGAMYICTEDAFPNRRLVQMVSLLQQRCPDIRLMNICFTDNVYVEHCADIVCIAYFFYFALVTRFHFSHHNCNQQLCNQCPRWVFLSMCTISISLIWPVDVMHKTRSMLLTATYSQVAKLFDCLSYVHMSENLSTSQDELC